MRAIKRAALRLHDVDNRAGTDAAWFVATAIDVQRLLEITRFAVRIDEVAQGGAALFNRTVQQLFDVSDQTLCILQAQRAAWRAWIDSAKEQRLVGVDIAHADDDVRLHQHGFDRAVPRVQALVQIGAVKGLLQRLGAEFGQEWMLQWVAGAPEQSAEAPWVMQAKMQPVGEGDVHMVMGQARGSCLHQSQTTRHAKMQQYAAMRQAQQDVLAASLDALNRISSQ